MRVLIIEDDFRIAKIHQEVIEKDADFQVVKRCLTAEDAYVFLETADIRPDVVLLDIFIPDVEGMELLEGLKRIDPYMAIIIASAANDMDTVRCAKLVGVFDYITKPVEQGRLKAAFQKYKDLMKLEMEEVSQPMLDRFFWYRDQQIDSKESKHDRNKLPKGIDTLTLEEVTAFIAGYHNQEITAQILGESVGISRSTARRYLEYLASLEVVHASLNYGQVGRPQRVYRLREQYEQN